MLQRLAKKKVLLLSALMVSGLVRAEESLPDVVKHFTPPAARRRGWGNIRTWA